jgi:hypothetical protein
MSDQSDDPFRTPADHAPPSDDAPNDPDFDWLRAAMPRPQEDD